MTINDYMADLERELRRRRALRARLLRETEDHLHDLCAELAADGLAHEQAEARAVTQFGAAATIAARFAEATASTTAHRAVTVTAAAFVAYTGVFVAFATAASPLLRDFPQGAGSFLGLQLAAVALGVAFVRSLRWRGALAAPTAEVTAIARALSVAGVVLLGAAAAEVAVAVSRPAGVIAWSDGRWLTLAFAAALAVLLFSAIAAVRAAAQAHAVHSLPSGRVHSNAAALLADDVETLLARARLPQASRALRGLLAHPWPATLALAVLAFVAVSAAGVVSSGRAGLAGAVALAAVEASMIVFSFVAFGRTLGLRDAARRRAR
jgi:HAAS